MWIVIGILAGLLLGGILLALGVLIGTAITENTHDRLAKARGETIEFP